MTDLHNVLRAILDADGNSARTYRCLYTTSLAKDPAAALVALAYLAVVVRGEDEVGRLIGDRALAMKGLKKTATALVVIARAVDHERRGNSAPIFR